MEGNDEGLGGCVAVDVGEDFGFLLEDFEGVTSDGGFDGICQGAGGLGHFLGRRWWCEDRLGGLGACWLCEVDVAPKSGTKEFCTVKLVVKLGEVIVEDLRCRFSPMLQWRIRLLGCSWWCVNGVRFSQSRVFDV